MGNLIHRFIQKPLPDSLTGFSPFHILIFNHKAVTMCPSSANLANHPSKDYYNKEVPPNMFDEAHTKLEIEETALIIDELNKKIDGSIFDALETTILSVNLPFYPGFRFLNVSDHATTPPLQRLVFQKNDAMDFIVIDWGFKTIQAINKASPINLNDENVIDYVRFYFDHVKGRHGRFIICETADHIQWKEEPSPEIKRSLNQALSPLELGEKKPDGSYTINAFMMLKDALFGVQVFVRPNGDVSMSDHQIVMEDIPVLDPVFMQ